MAEQILTAKALVRVCPKCGASDRNKRGDCIPCAKESQRRHKESGKKKATSLVRYEQLRDSEEFKKRNCENYAKWFALNKDAKNAREALFRETNPDKAYAPSLAWKKRNPGAVKIAYQNRRVREFSGKLSKGLVEKLFTLQRGKCPCCKKNLGKDFHMDHIVPLFLGGLNVDDNIQLLRSKCNLRKNAKEPIAYMQSKGFLL